jgi:polar amino acid transport system substrate-binding protein
MNAGFGNVPAMRILEPTRLFAFPLAVVLGLGLLISLGCSSLALPGDLRVGIQTDYPPLAFALDGKVGGIEADLALRAGELLDRRVRFVLIDRTNWMEALDEDRVDVVMAGVSVTPGRAVRVRFIEHYADVGQMAIIRRDQLAVLGRFNAIRGSGIKVGFVTGTTGERYVRETLVDAVPVPLPTVDSGERAVRDRSVDFFVHDAPTIWRLGTNPADRDLFGLYKLLTDEQLAWAVSRDNEALAARLDAVVLEMRANGDIDEIVSRWVPVRVTQ